MRRFLVGTLAAIGTLTLLVVVAGALVAWFWFPTAPELPGRIVLELDLRESLAEVPPSGPGDVLGLTRQSTLLDAVLALEQAARDERVRGLIARVGGDGPGLAQAQELRDAVARFRAAGKFAHAHADSFGEFGPGTRGYYLATAFDRIDLQPVGAVGLTGILIETPFLRGLLDRLGVLPSGDKRGRYKTAPDMYTDEALSPAHRESLESLADSLDRQIRAGIAEGRGLDLDAVGRLIDGGPYYASEALDAGLVDGLDYADQVRERAAAEGELIPLADYVDSLPPPPEDAPVIALVRGVGMIQRGDGDDGMGGGWVMAADATAAALMAAREDPEVTAIVFRIESGGGSAVASDTIGRQVRRAVESGKPVIVSMANVAASGGYWIAMDASRIVASPATLTGSIGVFAGKPVLRELFEGLGVTWGRVTRGANATMWTPMLDFDARGRARLESFLDQVYAAFVSGVARGRELDEAAVVEVAEGRVWTGEQARELNLVDELGGITHAVEVARAAAGLDEDQAIELRAFPPPKAPWEQALDLIGGSPFGLAQLPAWLRQIGTGLLGAPPIIVR
jgi:protease-4